METVSTLLLTEPATSAGIVLLRRRLVQWLAIHQVDDLLSADIVLAASEALTNVADHAYLDIDLGPAGLTATIEAAVITVAITDQGVWRAPPADKGDRGFGLGMIEVLSTAMEIRRAVGTTVTTRWSTTARSGTEPALAG